MSTEETPDAGPVKWTRAKDAERRYTIPDSTLRAWIREGKVDSVRVGRRRFISVASLEALFGGEDDAA
jgi:hypothetical protein